MKYVSEWQILKDFSHVFNEKQTNEYWEGKKGKKSLLNIESKLMVERLDMVGEMGNKAKRIESTFTLMSN